MKRQFNAIQVYETTNASDSKTGSLVVKGGVGVAGITYFGQNVVVESAGKTILNSTETSTSSTTGALQVTGGSYIGGGSIFGSTVTVSGVASVSAIADATGTGTGALQVTGGAYIGGKSVFGNNLDVKGNITVSGNIQAKGDLITTDSKEINIGDRYIFLNAQNTNLNEAAGIVVNNSAVASSSMGNTVGSNQIRMMSTISGLVVGDFLQVHDTANPGSHEGLYEVESVTVDGVTGEQVVTVKTGSRSEWCASGSSLGITPITSCVVSKVRLGIVRFESDGKLAFTSTDNSGTLIWKYPAASASAAYESVELQTGLYISKQTTHYFGGTANSTVYLPSNSTNVYDGSYFTVINSTDYECTVGDANMTPFDNYWVVPGNTPGPFVYKLLPGDKATFWGAKGAYYIM